MLNKTAQRSTLFAAALLLALTACATTPPAVTPSESAPVETPSSTPEPEEPVAVAIRISSESLAILDEQGSVLEEFTYFDEDVAPVVDALTEAIGTEPEDKQVDGTPLASWVEHSWGGLAIWDYTGETRTDVPSYPDQQSFRVVATSAAEGDIQIATKNGIAVGATADDVAEFSYSDRVDTGGTTDIRILQLEEVPVDNPGDRLGDGGVPASFHTSVWADPATGQVYRISAPGANFGH